MLVAKKISSAIFNTVTTSIRHYQVTVVGGGNEVGQVLCLMLRTQPFISKLIIQDTREDTAGIALDLSHIPTESSLKGFTGGDTLDRALKNADIIIATGNIQKPDVIQQTLFSQNSRFIQMLAKKIAKLSPMPFVGIVTEPINILVPMAAEILKSQGEFDSKKLFGITTVDVLRAQSLYAIENGLNPHGCIVPVIGGHSKNTIIPLISQAKPSCGTNDKYVQKLISKIRQCDESVTQAKRGWSPTLSVAYGALVFTRNILYALEGNSATVHAFIENNDFGTSYFAGLVHVNKNGAAEMQRYSNLSQYECHLLERSIVELRKDVLKGKKTIQLA